MIKRRIKATAPTLPPTIVLIGLLSFPGMLVWRGRAESEVAALGPWVLPRRGVTGLTVAGLDHMVPFGGRVFVLEAVVLMVGSGFDEEGVKGESSKLKNAN